MSDEWKEKLSSLLWLILPVLAALFFTASSSFWWAHRRSGLLGDRTAGTWKGPAKWADVLTDGFHWHFVGAGMS